jgi:hypothetical protein
MLKMTLLFICGPFKDAEPTAEVIQSTIWIKLNVTVERLAHLLRIPGGLVYRNLAQAGYAASGFSFF